MLLILLQMEVEGIFCFRVWGTATYQWRNFSQDKTLKKPEDEVLGKWLEKPNVFLFGQLYYLLLEVNIDESNKEKLRKQIRFAYRAEVAFIGAHLCMDDNIRDIDLAINCRSIGALYLKGIEFVLKIRELFGANKENNQFDLLLGFIYQEFHAASKRFLVNSIDIFEGEIIRERCFRQDLGNIYRALGDLLLIRAEVLEAIRIHEKKKGERDSYESNFLKCTFPGLVNEWKDVSGFIIQQNGNDTDTELFRVRRDADQAYRNACKQFHTELDEYFNRYKFSQDVFFDHSNVMDRRLHFLICSNIHARHWDYFNDYKYFRKVRSNVS